MGMYLKLCPPPRRAGLGSCEFNMLSACTNLICWPLSVIVGISLNLKLIGQGCGRILQCEWLGGKMTGKCC